MWRSWAGVVTRGLRLWGRVDVLPNSLKRLWRRLIVDKWTLNSRATALVGIPAVSIPIARSLKTCDICGIVLCDKTAHFRMAFYCGQPKAHLCNNGKMEMHSVANVATLHTTFGDFSPFKKSIQTSLFLSRSQFKCALLAWQKQKICISKAIATGMVTNSAHVY